MLSTIHSLFPNFRPVRLIELLVKQRITLADSRCFESPRPPDGTSLALGIH